MGYHVTEGAGGAAKATSRLCTPPATFTPRIIGTQGSDMVGGRPYLSFLTPFPPDLFIALPTLTLGSSPALLNSERGAQVLGSPPTPLCPCVHEGIGGVPLSP